MQEKEKIRVAALTSGQNTASARFRVRQYIADLSHRGIEVAEHIPRWGVSCGLPSPFKLVSRIPGLVRSRRADVIWLNKELVQGYLTMEGMLKRPRILDADDAIWLNPPLGSWAQPRMARAMDAVIAGNDYIAEYYSRFCKSVYIVPTAIDLRRFTLRPEKDEELFVIGWTGLRSNYKYLALIEPVLKRFLEDHQDSRLMLISNAPWKTTALPPEQVRYYSWNPRDEAAFLHKMSVGLMPLADDPWTRGKCSFKMLQYMAAGLPVIVSPVGMNRQVLEKGAVGLAAESSAQWQEALETLYADRKQGRTMGLAGRRVVEQFYSTEIAVEKLAWIFCYWAS